MNHNRVASVPWSVNMSQSSFSVGGFSLPDRVEDRNPWPPMATNSHFPRNVKMASPIALPAPEEFIQINCSTNRWNVVPISNPTNQIPKQNKVSLVAIPTVVPTILPTVGYKFVPNPNMGNIEEELTGQNLYKTELCRSFEETGTCRYGSKCQFAHGGAELRPILRHPKYKTEVCKTFHTIGTCPYGKRCRFIHTVPEAGNSSEGFSEENEAPLEDTQKDHPKAESLTSTSSVMPVTIVPSDFNGYLSKSTATSVQLSKLLSSNPSDWSTSWKGSGNVLMSKPKDVHQKCPKSDLVQLQRTVQVTDIPKFASTVVLVGLTTPTSPIVPPNPPSQRLSSKESAERRLAIFQQICAEEQI